jgi:hypothetical protein
MDFHKALYSPHELLGININTIISLIKDVGKILGFDITGLAFHCQFISSIVNEPGVSTKESLAALCHNSVTAQCPYPYQICGTTLEMSDFDALRLNCSFSTSSE